MYKRHSWRDDSKVLACQKLVRDAERKEQKKEQKKEAILAPVRMQERFKKATRFLHL